MDELSKLHSAIACSSNNNHVVGVLEHITGQQQEGPINNSSVDNNLEKASLEMSDLIKAQIANHPLYPNLLSAYLQCRKVNQNKSIFFPCFLLSSLCSLCTCTVFFPMSSARCSCIYIERKTFFLLIYEGWNTPRNGINS